MRIYVASSWRNSYHPLVVEILRQHGHDVYDFRHPTPDSTGFHWSDVDPNWHDWSPSEFISALKHPIAQQGFSRDMEALRAADIVILVLPCGRSAHLELGFAVGSGKKTAILLSSNEEAELMYNMVNIVCCNIQELLHWVSEVSSEITT